MSNTTQFGNGIIEITGLDADWDIAVDTPYKNGIRLYSILFVPSAADDILEIMDGGLATATLFYAKSSATSNEQIIYYHDESIRKPFIDISNCTLGTAANCRVVIFHR